MCIVRLVSNKANFGFLAVMKPYQHRKSGLLCVLEYLR